MTQKTGLAPEAQTAAGMTEEEKAPRLKLSFANRRAGGELIRAVGGGGTTQEPRLCPSPVSAGVRICGAPLVLSPTREGRPLTRT